jgi:hypothetical protein
MTNGSVPPPPPPPVHGGAPQKKGLSPWAWVGIGCLGVLVIGGIISAIVVMFIAGKVRDVAGEMQDDPIAAMSRVIAGANPEIELVEADKESRTVTFRNTETGEEMTFDYDDIEDGRISFSSGDETAVVEFDADENREGSGSLTITTDEGRATFGAGASADDVPAWVPRYPGTSPEGTYSTETPQNRAGAFHFETSASIDEILDYYQTELASSGLEMKTRTVSNEGAMAVVSSPDEGRTVTIACSQKGSDLEVVVNFTEKR